MKPTIKNLCGCRDPETKRQYPRGTCPKLGTRGHGFWEWRVRVPKEMVALVGRPELRGRETTKKAADKAAEDAIGRIRAGRQEVGGLTVGTYLTQMWMPGKRKLRPTTRDRYESFLRLYLVPYLGELPLAGLRSHHIATMFARIDEDNADRSRPAGPATQRDILDLLRAALNDAVKQRMVPFNPAVAVELPDHAPPEIEPWGAEEVGVFLDEAASDRLSVLYEIVALHGLRRGEACGATWDGLDELSGVLTIRQQITKAYAGGGYGVWPPKTRSGKRKVDVDAGTLGSLLAHRLRQEQDRDDIGADRWDNGTLPDEHGRPVHLAGLIFTRPDGRHLDPQYVTRRMQQIARNAGLLATTRAPAAKGASALVVGVVRRPAPGRWTLYVDREPVGEVTVVSAGREGRGSRSVLQLAEPLPFDVPAGAELGLGLLSRRRLHDLRHSSASIQLAAGVDLALVSKRLGHSTSSITANLYVHLLRSAGQAAAETVAGAIPRSAPRAHPVPIRPDEAARRTGAGVKVPGNKAAPHEAGRRGKAEARGFEPGREPSADDQT